MSNQDYNSQDVGKQTADQLGKVGKSALKSKKTRKLIGKGFKAVAKFMKFFIQRLIPALIKSILAFLGPYAFIIILLIVLLLIAIDGVASFDFFQRGAERNEAEILFDNTMKEVVEDRTNNSPTPIVVQIKGQQSKSPYPPVDKVWLQQLQERMTPSWAVTGILYSYKNMKHVFYRAWHKDYSNTPVGSAAEQEKAHEKFYDIIYKAYDYYFDHPSMKPSMTYEQTQGEKVKIRKDTTCTYTTTDEEGNESTYTTSSSTTTEEALPSRTIATDATLLYNETFFNYYWHDTGWIDSGTTSSGNCTTQTFKDYHLYLLDDNNPPVVNTNVNLLLTFLMIDNPEGDLARLVKVKDLEYLIEMAQTIDDKFPKFSIDYKGLKACAKGGNLAGCFGQFVSGIGAYCAPNKEVNMVAWESMFARAGVFSSYGQVFIEISQKQGIDPVIFAAIAFHETGFGTSNAVKNKNNPGGLMGKNGLMQFATLAEGLESMGRTLHNRIIKDGLTTLDKLGSVYAPVGASNDPTNLNSHWVPNVSKIVAQLGGLTMNCESYGFGQEIVFDGNVSEAVKTIINSGTRWIGNSVYVFGGGRNQSHIARGIFDCSSFVHWAFKQAGIDLGPLSGTSTETLNKKGRKINISEIQPGDIIFWDTYKRDGHVGIYIGNGQWIGCQTSTGVAIVSLNKPYYAQRFSGHVRRLIE